MLRRSEPTPEFSKEQKQGVRSVIVIGGSAGGRAAIGAVLKELSHDIPAAIIIMLHMSPASNFDLSEWFRQFGHIRTIQAAEGERLCEGVAYVAPPGRSVFVEEGELRLEVLNDTGPRHTINRLFQSVGQSYGERVIGVVLTGMLNDGAAGLRLVQEAGGMTIVQNPDDAAYGDMPTHALSQVPNATFRLNVADIGMTLDLLARRNAELETGIAHAIRLLKERIALLVRLLEQSKENEHTHRYLSTELRSLRTDLQSVERLLNHSGDQGDGGSSARP